MPGIQMHILLQLMHFGLVLGLGGAQRAKDELTGVQQQMHSRTQSEDITSGNTFTLYITSQLEHSWMYNEGISQQLPPSHCTSLHNWSIAGWRGRGGVHEKEAHTNTHTHTHTGGPGFERAIRQYEYTRIIGFLNCMSCKSCIIGHIPCPRKPCGLRHGIGTALEVLAQAARTHARTEVAEHSSCQNDPPTLKGRAGHSCWQKWPPSCQLHER
eukprot:1146747-Pelagomonas_calceolata.AAC.2